MIELNDVEQVIAETIAMRLNLTISSVSNDMTQCKNDNCFPFILDLGRKIEGLSIPLSEHEIYVAKMIGPMRTAEARKQNKKNMRVVDPKKEKFIEYTGIAGELAYAKKFNVYPHETFKVKARSIKEDMGDFIHTMDQTGRKFDHDFCVDVKTTEYETGRLFVADWKIKDKQAYLNKIHSFALITGNIDTGNVMTFRGFITSKDLIDIPPRPLKMNGKPLHWARQNQLTLNLNDIYQKWLKIRQP